MNGLLINGGESVKQKKLMVSIVLVVRPVPNVAPRVGRHIFPRDKYAYRFKRDHFPWLWLFNTVLRNAVFCGMVADAV